MGRTVVVATCYPSRMVEHLKYKSTQPNCKTTRITLYRNVDKTPFSNEKCSVDKGQTYLTLAASLTWGISASSCRHSRN